MFQSWLLLKSDPSCGELCPEDCSIHLPWQSVDVIAFFYLQKAASCVLSPRFVLALSRCAMWLSLHDAALDTPVVVPGGL